MQLPGLKGFAANMLVPYTTAQSCGVHASAIQSYFGGTSGTQYKARAFNVMADWCIYYTHLYILRINDRIYMNTNTVRGGNEDAEGRLGTR